MDEKDATYINDLVTKSSTYLYDTCMGDADFTKPLELATIVYMRAAVDPSFETSMLAEWEDTRPHDYDEYWRFYSALFNKAFARMIDMNNGPNPF